MSVTERWEVDFFVHAPYEKYWSIEHEDLSPMFFEATVRGRLEPGEEKTPTVTLKAPQNVREYFEFKNVPEDERSPERADARRRDAGDVDARRRGAAT